MIVCNIKQLMLDKSAKIGKKLSYAEVSRQTGINSAILCRLATKPDYCIRFKTLEILLDYFETSPEKFFIIKK